ncbi:MAG TPA: hypothetical protein VMU81_24380 [Acetobacteraceae bacterium]|jgi:hypothetical protein|nr:hypothetical protein [Acetobacteraceae bacterium]
MRDDESAAGDCHAAASGFMQCLQMLADEANKRHLTRTHIALRRAMRACRAEQGIETPPPRARRSAALH